MATIALDPARPSASVRHWAWGLLFLRTVTFLGAHALVVLGLALAGVREPWWSSAAWWPVTATLANLVGLALLDGRLRAEGLGWLDLLHLNTGGWGRRVLALLVTLPVIAAAAALPPAWIGAALWGDQAVGQALLIAPLPLWAALVSLVAFPVTTAAVELPTYAGYVLPRLRASGMPIVVAVLIVGLVLGVQHGALPFLPATQFFIWRTTMFIPFGLAIIAAIAWRPRLLPLFVGVHLLLDASVGALVWFTST
jgi:hypothetical protein